MLADHFVDMLYELKGEENPNPIRQALPENSENPM